MTKQTIICVLLLIAFIPRLFPDEWQPLTLINKEYLLKDFRLIVTSNEQIAEMVRQSKCRVIHGKEKMQYNDFEVGNGIEFAKLFLSSNSIVDSEVLLFKVNTIQRRPAWFATNSTAISERAFVDKTIITPGDVVWILPRDTP